MKSKILKVIYALLFIAIIYFVLTMLVSNFLPDFVYNINLVPAKTITVNTTTEDKEYVTPGNDIEENGKTVLKNIEKAIKSHKNIKTWGQYNGKNLPTFNLNDCIPYNYDYLYVTDAYSEMTESKNKEKTVDIEKQIGMKDQRILEMDKTDPILIIVKDKKIIAMASDDVYVYGYHLEEGLVHQYDNSSYSVYLEKDLYNSKPDHYEAYIKSKNTDHFQCLTYGIDDNWLSGAEYASNIPHKCYEYSKRNKIFDGDGIDWSRNILNVEVHERNDESDEEILKSYNITSIKETMTIDGCKTYFYKTKASNYEFDKNRIHQGYIIISEHCYYDVFIECEKCNYFSYARELKGVMKTITIDESYYD